MSCLQFNSDDFYSFVKHHIALVERFDFTEDKDVSIIFFKIKSGDKKEIIHIVENMLRETDALFKKKKNNYMVLLPGTSWNGAYELMCGIQEFLGDNKTDTIVSYPDDGKNARELLRSLSEMIEKDYSITISFTDIESE